MPYRNKQMLRDANGDLIPQYWDVAAGDFKPLTGSDGASNTRLTGSIVEEEIVSRTVLRGGSDVVYVRHSPGAKAIALYAQIYSSTGNFGDGQGLSIRATPRFNASQSFGFIESVKVTGSAQALSLHIGTGYGVGKSDGVIEMIPRYNFSNMGIAPLYSYQLRVDGTFGAGEGIDCALHAHYIY